jgi:hypothetical protein
MQQVANSLASCGEVGPGAVFRAIREAQRAQFDVPNLGRGSGSSKYR